MKRSAVFPIRLFINVSSQRWRVLEMPSFSVGWYCGYQHGVWIGSALWPSGRQVVFLNKKVEEDILGDKGTPSCCGTESSKHSSSELSGFRHSFHVNQGRADCGEHWREMADGVKARTPAPNCGGPGDLQRQLPPTLHFPWTSWIMKNAPLPASLVW